MMLFGGVDTRGFKLNDLRVFDLVNNVWRPATTPLGAPPAGRSYTSMLALGPSYAVPFDDRVIMFGGSATSSVQNDVQFYDAASCSPLTYSGASTVTGHAGTYTVATCNPTFTSTNNGNQLVCDPTTGIWQGLYNLATGQVCLPPPQPPPTVNGATALSPTTVSVSYTLPAGSTYALVSANWPTYVERFASTLGPSDYATNWKWRNSPSPATTSYFSFPSGTGRIDSAGAVVDCTGACPNGACVYCVYLRIFCERYLRCMYMFGQFLPPSPPISSASLAGGTQGACVNNCPMLLRTWPAGVSNTDYEFEAWVAFDSNVVQPNQFAGIGLVQDFTATAAGLYALEIYAGLMLTFPTGAPVIGLWQVST